MLSPKLFMGAAMVLALSHSVFAQTSCMVLGEPTARITTSQGERSPVFIAAACDALRLISGKAQASWIGRDGKPHMVSITPQGVTAVPAAGREERSVNVVWAELTTTREKQQPAYMRSVGTERLPKVYIPLRGLTVVSKVDGEAVLHIKPAEEGSAAGVASEASIASGQPVIIARDRLVPGESYVIQIQRGHLIEEWRWQALPLAEVGAVDTHMAEIASLVDDPTQRGLMQAMLFEQLKLRPNLDLEMQQLRSASMGRP